MGVNIEEIQQHVKNLENDIGKQQAAVYLSHVLLRDTTFECDNSIKDRLRQFGADLRNSLNGFAILACTPIFEDYLRRNFEHIPLEFHGTLSYLLQHQETKSDPAPEKKAKPKKTMEFTELSMAGYARTLKNQYDSTAIKMPQAVRDALESVLQTAVVGKDERILMVEGKNGNKITKALEAMDFNVQNVKCKNGKHRLTVSL